MYQSTPDLSDGLIGFPAFRYSSAPPPDLPHRGGGNVFPPPLVGGVRGGVNCYTKANKAQSIKCFFIDCPRLFASISITSVIGSLTIRNFKVTHTHEIYEKTRKGIFSQIIRTYFRDLFANFVGLVELLTKNSMDYILNTERDKEIMLKEMGISSFESLLEDIPKSLRNFPLTLQKGLSEPEVLKLLQDLSKKIPIQIIAFHF